MCDCIQHPRTVELDCVLREVAPNDHQYVPVSEVPELFDGETIYHGLFTAERENLGPSGSHVRTICQPVGQMRERTHGAA